jgi:hypothetical protein
MSRSILAFVAVAMFWVSPAIAGIADTPLPSEFKKIAYSTAGVIARSDVGTIFMCTNADDKDVHVGVEVFSVSGLSQNDPTATAVTLPAGDSVAWGTSGFADLLIDRDLGLMILNRGSARILSDGGSLVCTVALADRINSPPTFMMRLTLVAKTKQKGD